MIRNGMISGAFLDLDLMAFPRQTNAALVNPSCHGPPVLPYRVNFPCSIVDAKYFRHFGAESD